jgi:hypothetical protein
MHMCGSPNRRNYSKMLKTQCGYLIWILSARFETLLNHSAWSDWPKLHRPFGRYFWRRAIILLVIIAQWFGPNFKKRLHFTLIRLNFNFYLSKFSFCKYIYIHVVGRYFCEFWTVWAIFVHTYVTCYLKHSSLCSLLHCSIRSLMIHSANITVDYTLAQFHSQNDNLYNILGFFKIKNVSVSKSRLLSLKEVTL